MIFAYNYTDFSTCIIQTLEKKHMLQRRSEETSESHTQTQAETNTDLPQDRPVSDNNNDDIETGFVRGIDPPERDDDDEENKEEEEDVQYTHVSIPLPGYNFDCEKPVVASDEDGEKKNNTNNSKEGKKSLIRLFGSGKGKEESVKEDEVVKEDPTIDLTTTLSSEVTDKGGRRRSCPIFCAICLAEYELKERVSWSSNTNCTHVFHEDCVVKWLVSLGKTKSKQQRFTRDPTEAQLFQYELECPCCRQEFISREQADLPQVCGGGDERV